MEHFNDLKSIFFYMTFLRLSLASTCLPFVYIYPCDNTAFPRTRSLPSILLTWKLKLRESRGLTCPRFYRSRFKTRFSDQLQGILSLSYSAWGNRDNAKKKPRQNLSLWSGKASWKKWYLCTSLSLHCQVSVLPQINDYLYLWHGV